jgi:hypothetical protein
MALAIAAESMGGGGAVSAGFAAVAVLSVVVVVVDLFSVELLQPTTAANANSVSVFFIVIFLQDNYLPKHLQYALHVFFTKSEQWY